MYPGLYNLKPCDEKWVADMCARVCARVRVHVHVRACACVCVHVCMMRVDGVRFMKSIIWTFAMQML